MGDIAMTDATGYVSADELVELADAPESLAAGFTPTIIPATAVTTVIVGASAAMQGGCPTSGCTKRC
ncbi:class II lanthipeptide, LchA2/BrtA2 family [Streptomyces baarnensis]|uniref:class II lanthipeptide, LchA2/BrtA2 family n=1 Tax=Streptomyces baarnensis TaxID=66872 RepID=UPI0004AA4135|nr:class II lanthipeptide, LchA2/BrtA2 family [Streptomyces baarnensis]